jgi:hypothetical protein
VVVISLFLPFSSRSADLASVDVDVAAGAPSAAAAPLVLYGVFTALVEAAMAFWARLAVTGETSAAGTDGKRRATGS